MPASEVDSDAADGESFERKLALLSVQYQQVKAALTLMVTCPCGRQVSVVYAYRCRQCSLILCGYCSLRHFGLRQEGRRIVRESDAR